MMANLLAHPVLAWALTWLVHSTLLLGAVWLFERLRPHSAPRLREYLWRVAILVSLISATAVTTDFSSYPAQHIEIKQTDLVLEGPEPVPAPTIAAQPVVEKSAVQYHSRPTHSEIVASDRVGFAEGLEPSPAWILWVWGSIAALLFVRLYRHFIHAVAHLGNRTSLEANHRACFLLERLLARVGGGRPPALTTSLAAGGPVSLPGNEICLPRWTLAGLREPQLEGVLAHELAHCLRHDPLTLLLVDGLRRLLFMQPLLHVAARRLAELAELAADEKAVELTGNQHAIAESLAECAGRLRSAEPSWGVAMAQNPSSFMYRIRRLLHPERFTIGGPAWYTRMATMIAALVLALSLPGFVVAAKSSGTRTASSAAVIHDDGKLTAMDLSIRETGYSMEVQGTGDFSLNDDETDVVDMAKGAKLTVEEGNGTLRKIRFVKESDTVERTYWVDGKRIELDGEAREWLSEMLPRLMRESGIKDGRRVERLYEEGGADRVLDEIELIEGDYTVRKYAGWLVRNDVLEDRQYDKLLDAADRIGSDYERRTLLVDIARHQKMNDRRAAGLLEVGGKIESDHELRVFVERLVANSNIERIAIGRLIDVIASIDSDYEMRAAFEATLEGSEIPADGVPHLMLISGREIDSGHELLTILLSLADRINSHPDSALAYIGATLELDSDYERRKALAAFAEHTGKNSAGWAIAIRAAASIGGEYERAEALIRLARRMPITEETQRLYRQISKTLGPYQRERAQKALRTL